MASPRSSIPAARFDRVSQTFSPYTGSPLGHLGDCLPPLKNDSRFRTVHESNSLGEGRQAFSGTLEEWDAREIVAGISELRKLTEDLDQSRDPRHQMTSVPETLSVRSEGTVEGRFHNNVHAFILRAMDYAREGNVSLDFAQEIIIGDSRIAAMGSVPGIPTGLTSMRRTGRNLPDFVVCLESDHLPICVGEIKTPWTKNLAVAVSKMNEENADYDDEILRKELGQIATYMKLSRLKYGYYCTYQELILLRQVKIDGAGETDKWVLQYSPVFFSNMKSHDIEIDEDFLASGVSIREALLYLIRLCLTDEHARSSDNQDKSWFREPTYHLRSGIR